MEKIPHLINQNGLNLKDMESEKRAEILSEIKEKRAQRDSVLKESSSLKTRVKDIFGSNNKEKLKMEAKKIQDNLYGSIYYKEKNISNELKEKALDILRGTIQYPLLKLTKIYYERGKDLSQISNKELIDEEEEITKNFKFENIAEGFYDNVLREKIILYIDDFLSHRIVWNTLTDNPNYGDDNFNFSIKIKKEADGFPIELAKSTLMAVDSLINKEGVSNLKKSFKLFHLIEVSKNLCSYQTLDESLKNNLLLLMNEKGLQIDIFYLANLSNLVDFAVSNSVEFKNKLDDKIKKCFLEKEWGGINNACKSSSKYLSEKTLEGLDNYLKKYGMEIESIKNAWELYPSNEHYKNNNIEGNINRMEELESNRPGIVESLFKEFGIKEFQRYPIDVLIKQFDTKDQNLPYGIVLFTNDDHNDAFDLNNEVIESLFKQMDNRLLMRIAEFESNFSFLKKLASFNKRYGKKNKIEYLLWGAHGWPLSIGEIGSRQLNGDGAKKTKDFFIDNPEIILASCSTGEEGAIAQKISEIYSAVVHAPSKETNLKNVLVNFDSQNKPHFKVKFNDNSEKMYSLGKKISDSQA